MPLLFHLQIASAFIALSTFSTANMDMAIAWTWTDMDEDMDIDLDTDTSMGMDMGILKKYALSRMQLSWVFLYNSGISKFRVITLYS